jgi:glycosyltransferase involved in cell wall biosynthesis
LEDLKRTVDSIASQTFTDFELIVIKDDQEQTTLKALKSIHTVVESLVIIDNLKNIGLVKSLNKALKRARGLYIARIDVGDWWQSQKLKDQYHIMIEGDFVLTGTQVKLLDTDLNTLKDQLVPLSDSEIRKYLENGKNPFVHSSVMFKRVQNVLYNENALHTEDFELWCRYYFFGQMSSLNKFYTNYIVDTNSITGSKRYLMFANATIVYINFIKQLYGGRNFAGGGFITSPIRSMNYSEKIFSKYYSMAIYEKLQNHRYKYFIFILLSLAIKPKVLFLMIKRKLTKFYYSSFI